VLAEKLKLRMGSDRTPRGWMTDWSFDNPMNISESSRYKCFAEVEAMAERILVDEESSIKAARMPSGTQGHPDTHPVWHNKLFRLLCLSYFEKLAHVLRNHNAKYLVIAFDEFSQLKTMERPLDLHPSLIALLHIIKAYDLFKAPDITFWFPFVDTDLSIYKLACGSKAQSMGLTKDLRILPPWPYVGFNQMVPKNIISRIQLPSDVLSIEHLKMYGRPVSIFYLAPNV
jgi:hypothetical protein